MPSVPRVFVIGAPGVMGGADTECWATVRLWLKHDVPVTIVPTWDISLVDQNKLEDVGCTVHNVQQPDKILEVPGITDGITVSFCNAEFFKAAERIRPAGRLVWVNCMCWVGHEELQFNHRYGPLDLYIFQSRFQKRCVLPHLARYGVKDRDCRLIRGAFWPKDYTFFPRPHPKDTEFYVGKLCRPDHHKWHHETWKIYGRIPYQPLRARVMGWHEEVEKNLGKPPEWAQVLPAGAESSSAFLSTLHAMVPVNGGARENWPRVGLEAMAAGVPLVVENRWGWREMVTHGKNGFLCDDYEQMAHYCARLANDEDYRLTIASMAHASLDNLANPDEIWEGWRAVFEEMA